MDLKSPETDALIKTIIGLAMKVHRELGMGFLASIYANALSFELARLAFHSSGKSESLFTIGSASWVILSPTWWFGKSSWWN
jgi:hypothetical protein